MRLSCFLPQIRRGGVRLSLVITWLMVGLGAEKRENYDPTAPTVGLNPANKFSYGPSVV